MPSSQQAEAFFESRWVITLISSSPSCLLLVCCDHYPDDGLVVIKHLWVFHQGKECGATDAALLVAPPPYLFRGVEERELEPTKGCSPRCAAGGLQVSSRLLGSAETLCSFVWSPIAFSACLFFWFGFLSCSLVSCSSLFVLCLLCVSAGYLAPQHRKADVLCSS